MNVIETLYKPILPNQMRQFWQSSQTFGLADFAGQKFSYFFTSQNYAEHLANTYAKELGASCYVLAFEVETLAYKHISFARKIDEDSVVFSIPIGNLDLCFPNVHRVTQVVNVCTPSKEKGVEQYELFNSQKGPWEPMLYGL